jgi:hypothetical protein
MQTKREQRRTTAAMTERPPLVEMMPLHDGVGFERQLDRAAA